MNLRWNQLQKHAETDKFFLQNAINKFIFPRGKNVKRLDRNCQLNIKTNLSL
jgi:ribosomal protein L31E